MHLISNYYNHLFGEVKNYIVYSNGQLNFYPLNQTQQFLRRCGLYRFTHKNAVINQVVERMFTNEVRLCENPQRLTGLLRGRIRWDIESNITLKMMLGNEFLSLLPLYVRGLKRKIWPQPSPCIQMLAYLKNGESKHLFTNREKRHIAVTQQGFDKLQPEQVDSFFSIEMIPNLINEDFKCRFNNQEFSILNCQSINFCRINSFLSTSFSLVNLGNNQFLFFKDNFNQNRDDAKCPFTTSVNPEGSYPILVEMLGEYARLNHIPSSIDDEELLDFKKSLDFLVNSFQSIYRDLRSEAEVNIYYAASDLANDAVLAQFGWEPAGLVEINTGNNEFNQKLYRLKESYEITEPTIYFGMALGYIPAPVLNPNNKT